LKQLEDVQGFDLILPNVFVYLANEARSRGGAKGEWRRRIKPFGKNEGVKVAFSGKKNQRGGGW